MKASACRRCGASVWRGPDSDVIGHDAVVDTTPISVTGEALAVIAGLATYAVDAPSRRHARQIWRRRHWQIGRPDPAGGTLHAAHHCDHPIPPDWVAPPPPTASDRLADDSKELMF